MPPSPSHHLLCNNTFQQKCMINFPSENRSRPLGRWYKQAACVALELLITKAITLCTAKQLPHDFMRAVLIYECNQLQPNAPKDVRVSGPLCPMMMDCRFNGVIVALVAIGGVIH